MSRLGAILAIFAVSLLAGPARAQDRPTCPPGNLLAKRAPVQWLEIKRDMAMVTDERITPEGAVWDASPAVILNTAESTLTWDLGTPAEIRAVAIQADANDSYVVWGSSDGNDYQTIGQIEPVPGHGLRTRTINLSGTNVRFLRVGGRGGDNFYSVSEVAAYCQVPTPFPAAMQVVDAPVGLPDCPTGNLLAKRAPVQWVEIKRDMAMATDEKVAPEGALWDSAPAVIFDSAVSTLTWDLGALTAVRSLAVQADANDTYTIWGSADGNRFEAIGQVEPATGHGLRTRTVDVGGAPVRFLRLGEGVGDGFFSVSEVAAYCQLPSPFPAAMTVVDAPLAPQPPKGLYDIWNNDFTARIELVLAILAALLLWWERRLIQAGMEHVRQRTRKILLATFGILGFLTFFNFGFWHFPGFVHGWDTFHYYVGSKYFKELHYERLYECVAVADAEEPNLRRRVELRKLTNLRTNVVETTAYILAHPEQCKSHFTSERWEAFKNDLRYFRGQESARRWDDAQTDHGFNGTPVWNVLGTLLANTGSASKLQIYALDAIDPILITVMTGLLWWAFGWRAIAVAIIVFGTNFPSRWYWTGGSFLRWDWIFWMVLAVVLLKKEKPFWAGACISYAAMLRIFPGFMFVAPLLAGAYQFARTRRVEAWIRKILLGGVVACALLIPVSFAVSGGPTVYKEFIFNTVKHQNTPLTNHMGLRTIVAFRPSETSGRMHAQGFVDPWLHWKEARLKAFKQALPVYVALVAAYLVLLALAIRGLEPWAAVALSSTVILFGAELTCYYYAFLILPALLYVKVRKAGEWMLWTTAITQFIGWAPIKGLPNWIKNLLPAGVRESSFVKNFTMSTALDEQYTWMSLVTLIAFVLIAYELYKTRKTALAAAATPEGAIVTVDAEPQPAAAKEAEDEPAETAASAPEPSRQSRKRRR